MLLRFTLPFARQGLADDGRAALGAANDDAVLRLQKSAARTQSLCAKYRPARLLSDCGDIGVVGAQRLLADR